MTIEHEPLSGDRISERAEICFAVDAQCCQDCGKPFPEGVASDPAWFIDSVLAPNPNCPTEPLLLAEIHCPDCW